MNCTKCKENIDTRRLKALPKTKVCVNCSTAEAVSCVDVIYHKTGNTIHHLHLTVDIFEVPVLIKFTTAPQF